MDAVGLDPAGLEQVGDRLLEGDGIEPPHLGNAQMPRLVGGLAIVFAAV